MPMTNDTPLFLYTLRLADDALVLGHRLSEWCGHAPVLEEDLALGNMALDLIGQARSLYAYAGQLEARGRDEDTLAYRRDAGEYRNVLLVEQPNGDFAVTILRQLLYAACAHPYFEALTRAQRSSPITFATPASGPSGLATAPRRAIAARSRRSTICGRTRESCSRPTTSSGR